MKNHLLRVTGWCEEKEHLMARGIKTERLRIINNDPAHIDHVMALMSFWEVAKKTGAWIFPPDCDQVIERMQKLQ